MNERVRLTLAALATAALPDRDFVAVSGQAVSSGDITRVNVVDSTGAKWTLARPDTEAAGAEIIGQLSVLQLLLEAKKEGKISFAVPAPAGWAPLLSGGKAVIYPAFEGAHLDEANLSDEQAKAFGDAIAQLHQLPTSLFTAQGLPTFTAEECRNRLLADLDEAAPARVVPKRLWHRWDEMLENVSWWRFTPRFVHGSLGPDSLLFEGGRISAMQDLSAAHVGDPARDFSWLSAIASEQQNEVALAAYRGATPDPHFRERADLDSELALVRWLLHGMHRKDIQVIEDARQMLRDLADLVLDNPDPRESVSAAFEDASPVIGTPVVEEEAPKEAGADTTVIPFEQLVEEGHIEPESDQD